MSYSHEFVTFWYLWNIRTTNFVILIGTSFSQMSNFRRVKNSHVFVTPVKNSFEFSTYVTNTCEFFIRVTDSFECESQTNLSQVWKSVTKVGKFRSIPFSGSRGEAITRWRMKRFTKSELGTKNVKFVDRLEFGLVLAQLDIEVSLIASWIRIHPVQFSTQYRIRFTSVAFATYMYIIAWYNCISWTSWN